MAIWNSSGKVLLLVHKDEFEQIPDGAVLWSINGNRVVKGRDYIDGDDRGGWLAYGVEVGLDALGGTLGNGEGS